MAGLWASELKYGISDLYLADVASGFRFFFYTYFVNLLHELFVVYQAFPPALLALHVIEGGFFVCFYGTLLSFVTNGSFKSFYSVSVCG